MAADKNEFRHESMQDRLSIVKYLNALSEGIQNGRLQFHDEGHEILLEPSGLLNLVVKAKRSESKTKLTLRLSWKESRGDADDGDLVIDSL